MHQKSEPVLDSNGDKIKTNTGVDRLGKGLKSSSLRKCFFALKELHNQFHGTDAYHVCHIIALDIINAILLGR